MGLRPMWNVEYEGREALDQCPDKLAAALDVLEDVVGQACMDETGALDSMCISAYASALRYLEEHGRVVLKVNDGRIVSGRFVREGA